eukprot:CAMPEP_0119275816 /NCGR_PEP_ID=MMETSP1329-20130426/14475_1 /TAXON_ID=114041 /ORGANISM="Genus nov. species nov., Strain RCC1024" /LENGTH=140 /DNA_ID=CAMNT_0007276235 /DNA_START=171 /DNA_END=590 /DNA_ORIENTATION=-
MPSDAGAERALDKLRLLPENIKCANCGVVAKRGHGAIVMTYATFVCHTCKSAHQSFSHLCKSASMSFWSNKEVAKLKAGGNALARATWMANMPEGAGLSPGASLQASKDFVARVYNEKRYYGDAAAHAAPERRAKPPKPK